MLWLEPLRVRLLANLVALIPRLEDVFGLSIAILIIVLILLVAFLITSQVLRSFDSHGSLAIIVQHLDVFLAENATTVVWINFRAVLIKVVGDGCARLALGRDAADDCEQ